MGRRRITRVLLGIARFLLLSWVGNLLLLLLVFTPLYSYGLQARQAWLVALPFIAIIIFRIVNEYD